MGTTFCPHCHQRMPKSTRVGVALTELKARIFDMIKRRDGVTKDDINIAIFDGTAKPDTIKAHIWQINDALMDTGVRIRSFGKRPDGYYYLKTEKSNG